MLQTIIVSNFGSFIGKKSERMVVSEGGSVVKEIPLFRIGEVIIGKKGVSISTDFLAEASQRGIRISCIDMGGKPYCMISAASLNGTVSTKRMQLKAFHDDKGLTLAKVISSGKLRNQANLLKYFNKYQKEANPDSYEAIAEVIAHIDRAKNSIKAVTGNNIDHKRQEILGLEGNAGKEYWRAVTILLKSDDFKGREHRGTTNVTNALFNYGYGILYSKIWGAVLNAGLEPYAGFLHVDRPGKPSMVLDFVEEFRQPVVDRTIIAMLNKGAEFKMENGLLDGKSREKLAEKILERLEDKVEFKGKQYALKSIIQIQARNVGTFLRDGTPYTTYAFKW